MGKSLTSKIKRSPEVEQKFRDIMLKYIEREESKIHIENFHKAIMNGQWESK